MRGIRGLACVALLVAAAGQVQAGIITFTDRATWEAAVGTFSNEDFNSIVSDTVFTDGSLVFPDLTLQSSGGAVIDILVDVLPYESDPGGSDIDGTARVSMGGLGYPDSVVTIQFNSPVAAFGFDTVNYDSNDDSAQAFIGGALVGSFPTLDEQTGFIGVLDTAGATISSVNILGEPNPIKTTFNAFDNVSFTAQVDPAVPEPTSLAIFGLVTLGMAVVHRRRKRPA